jgi:hypothetical protein
MEPGSYCVDTVYTVSELWEGLKGGSAPVEGAGEDEVVIDRYVTQTLSKVALED